MFARHFVIDDMCINVDERTPFAFAESDKIKVAIIGIAIDTKTGDSKDVIYDLINKCGNIEDVISYEYYLGGKYVLFIEDNGIKYIMGDATCSMKICYYIKDGCLCVASDPFVIARDNNLVEDDKLVKIRKSSELSQAMPYDITTYRDIKQLLPNHIINLQTGTVKRVLYPNLKLFEPKEAASIIIPLATALLEGYKQYFDLIVPITSGKDSRVVLALARRADLSIRSYTLKHKTLADDSQDLVISKQLTDYLGVPHEQHDDVFVPNSYYLYFDKMFLEDRYSKRMMKIAFNVYVHYNRNAVISGDIIGQIGKCSLHRDIPAELATAGYFRCKIHNFSADAKKYMQCWIDEVKASNERISLFDLFSIENRMGRWAAEEIALYNYMGQPILNIFNSRAIIAAFCSVDRKQRKDSSIHYEMLKQIDKSFLDVPFSKDGIIGRVIKRNGVLFYFASYAKFHIDRLKFLLYKRFRDD